MTLVNIVRAARLQVGLLLVRFGAKVAGTAGSVVPADEPDVPVPMVEIGPAARQMIEDGQRRHRRRAKTEPVAPLEGSAQARIAAVRRARGE